MIAWLALGVVGCVEDVGKDKAVAEVAPVPVAEQPAPTPVATAPGELPVPALAAGTPVKIDRARSAVGATGAKITAIHPITFHTFDGAVGLDGDTVTGVAFAAQIGSIEADQPKLTEHLKKPDFLDAATWPYATFGSTEVKPGAPGGTHTVTGDLTIRGKTLRVTFPATIAVSPTEVTANTEFVVNRQDFGVTYPGKPDDLVQDNVVLKIAFVAPRGAPAGATPAGG
ncbi:MAG: YceI family protein [Myxococcota bacterium]